MVLDLKQIFLTVDLIRVQTLPIYVFKHGTYTQDVLFFIIKCYIRVFYTKCDQKKVVSHETKFCWFFFTGLFKSYVAIFGQK